MYDEYKLAKNAQSVKVCLRDSLLHKSKMEPFLLVVKLCMVLIS